MIKIEGLHKSYEGTAVLHDISININEGSCVGIIGPNGSGKSTLLKAMTGTEPYDDGMITLDGKNIAHRKRHDLAKYIAVLPQDPLPPIPYRVEDVVLMGRYPHRNRFYGDTEEDIAVVNTVFEKTGLESYRNRPLDQLSGGERQRVAIARTLAQQPKVILLDEPTTFLDIGHQVEILHVLKEWQQNASLTMVIVLHDLNIAAQYCDQLVLMNKGRIVVQGKPEEVMTASRISEVYGTKPIVVTHPVSHAPQMLLQL